MSNFLMHPDPLSSLQCVAPWTESFQGHKFLSTPSALQNHTDTVNSLYSGHCRDLELVSSLARVHNRARNNFRIVSGHDDRPNSFLLGLCRIVSGRSNVYDELLF